MNFEISRMPIQIQSTLFFAIVFLTSIDLFAQKPDSLKLHRYCDTIVEGCVHPPKPFMPGMTKFLRENVVYPPLEFSKAIEGSVEVCFTVAKNGSLVDVRICNTDPRNINFEKEALRVVSMMPRWKPAILCKDTLSVKCIIPFNFVFDDSTVFNMQCEFDSVPEFDGLKNYLMENVVFPPEEFHSDDVSVSVEFIVEEDGSLSNIKILNSKTWYFNFEKEALRVISKMPKWKPGILNGERVRVMYELTVEFKLDL